MVNLDKVKNLARDLRNDEPRSPNEKLGGFELAARCLDKCRASLVGWEGDFIYGCPMDQSFLKQAQIDSNDFKKFVATGATDAQVDEWIQHHSHAHA